YSAKALTTLCKCVEGKPVSSSTKKTSSSTKKVSTSTTKTLSSTKKISTSSKVSTSTKKTSSSSTTKPSSSLIEVFKLVAVKDVLKDIFAKIVKVFVQDLIFIQNHVEIFLEAPENFVFVQNFFEDNLKVFVYVIDAQDFKHVEQKWNFHELVQVFVVDSHVFIIGSHVLFVVPYIFLIVVSYIFVIVNPHTLSLSPYIFFVGWLIFVISLVVHFN
ncbi:hypothetical protein D6D11_10276, partial [Aureobasidium pullulans]